MKKLALLFTFFFLVSNAQHVEPFYTRRSFSPPTFGLICQWFDGTISGDSLIDRSVNHRNAFIGRHDFSLLKGIPYKTAAYIQQRPDSYGHVPDVDNFWFDGNGIPNQIPVTAFFQDINYAHQIFCRHSSQKLNGNGVEINEPAITEIVTYQSPLAGTKLASARVYYHVPAESIVNVLWCDGMHGNDTTGNGTKSNPYRKLSKASSLGSNGSVIYCKNGIMLENAPTLLNKQITFISTGNCHIQTSQKSASLYSICSGITFTGFSFSGSNCNGTNGAIFLFQAGGNNTTIDRCSFSNTTSGVRTFTYSSVLNSTTIKNSVFAQDNSSWTLYAGNSSATISTNFFNVSSPSSYAIRGISGGEIKYNRFYHCNTQAICLEGTTSAGMNIKNNLFDKGTSAVNDIELQMATRTAGVTISDNTFLAASNRQIILETTGSADPSSLLTIERNVFTINHPASATADIIKISNQSRVIVSGNTVTTMNTTGSFINIVSAGNVMSGVSVINNRVTDLNTGGYMIKVGFDGSDPNMYKIVNPVINGNLLTGCRSSDIYSSTHSIIIGYCTGGTCSWNNIRDAGCGIIVKGDDYAADSGVVAYNLMTNCNVGLLLKGCRNNRFYGNTIVSSHTKSLFYGIEMVYNNPKITEGNDLRNNIVYCLGNNPSGYCVYFTNPNEHPNSFNNNLYYNVNPGKMCKDTAFEKTFTGFRAIAGYDLQGEFSYHPMTNFVPDVPVTIAADLGLRYDTGIDPATSWGTLPPLFKIQSQPWQSGCYIR